VASDELAQRWVAAASLHPFARFHHAQGFAEPFRSPTLAAATRAAMAHRYALLPALYTAGAQAMASGCPIARPLWFGWPAAAAARAAAGAWLVGDALLVAPALAPGVTSVDAWLPPGELHSVPGWERVEGKGAQASLPAPLGAPPPTLLLPGRILSLATGAPFNTTAAARGAPLALAAALPPDGETPANLACGRLCPPGTACGDVYLDGGEDEPGAGKGRVLAVDVSGDRATLTWPGAGPCDRVSWPSLTSFVLLGSRAATVAGGAPRRGGAGRRAAAARVPGGVALTFDRGGIPLRCPDEVDIEWRSEEKAR
jgi:hypothetical protein